MNIRALIVEDEPLMRERLRGLLADEPDVAVAGECASGPEAVTALAADRPDLVFLDVQMPGLNGFEVIEAVGVERMPATVFVTAYDRYALKAFEVHALDYLLKPFNRQRFRQALGRARARLRQGEAAAMHGLLRALLADLEAARGPRRLVVKSDSRIALVKPEDVDWVEAAGNYVRLHVGKDEHLLRCTMEAAEAQLPAGKFVRIHRSSIVNIDRVRALEPAFHGDYVVQLQDGTELPLSRTYRARLEELMGWSL